MSKKGKLYLIPTPLGEEHAIHTLPQYVVEVIHRMDYFIAERAKTARHFIKQTKPVKAFNDLTFFELNKRTEEHEWAGFLAPCKDGNDIGLMSEAGCPGVADPGAVIVEMAHEQGIEVVPLVGPSSILMALMASGMNGQNFAFNGYLSPKKPDLVRDLKRMEQVSSKHRQAQIFIETPYRNMGFMETALTTLNPSTKLCVAVDISLPSEWILTKTVKDWKKTKLPDLHKRPCIFILQR